MSEMLKSERFLFDEAQKAYFKACETSQPEDWLQAGLLAQQHRNALEKLRAHCSAVSAEAIRTATLWFEQQIENAKQDQISGFASGPQVRGERAHARHCAMYEAQQVFLESVRSLTLPQTAPSDIERAFQDACDEAGCAYDNEALLEAIHALKERCQAESEHG